jgi:hypothetical protein
VTRGSLTRPDHRVGRTDGGAQMSRTRVHNLSISLDGFATGEPQSDQAPFGHAGHRLHEWIFGTRFWPT